MPLFNRYVAVDWSSSATRTRVDTANSIWIAICNVHGTPELENHTTREEAMDRIETMLNEAPAKDHRLLCGFDFSFGYPERTAQMLTGRACWEAVWEQIYRVIVDRPDNWNNRFKAAALNKAFAGEGPFWGMPRGRLIEGLLPTRPRHGWDGYLPPRLRYAEEEVPRAHEVWQLFGAGSVGSQALTGIARLQGLRQRRADVRVWPFETLGEEGESHVLAEIYPSLIEPCPDHEVRDAGQVEAVAVTLRELDRAEQLGQYLRAPGEMPARVRREEGAILN
jgi:precorrin-8X/cobalt-precorrin-8 methylmutase